MNAITSLTFFFFFFFVYLEGYNLDGKEIKKLYLSHLGHKYNFVLLDEFYKNIRKNFSVPYIRKIVRHFFNFFY